MFCWWLFKSPDFTLCLSLSLVNTLIRLWWWWTWRDLDWNIFGGQVREQNSGSKWKKKQVGDVIAKKPNSFSIGLILAAKNLGFFFFLFWPCSIFKIVIYSIDSQTWKDIIDETTLVTTRNYSSSEKIFKTFSPHSYHKSAEVMWGASFLNIPSRELPHLSGVVIFSWFYFCIF